MHLENGTSYDAVPPSKYRWDLLGSQPGVAALFFKNLINNVIRGIFGRVDGLGPSLELGLLPLVEAYCITL